ncbi:MAG: GTP cyclohydrolase I FolE [Dehalococcoidia bacterium]|nr:GTP cyclohydrolase I FolE [Dehalococcoidia bacterium]
MLSHPSLAPSSHPVRIAEIEDAFRSVLNAIGEDPGREGLVTTPARIAEMYGELFSGLTEDPLLELSSGFEEGHQEMVILKDIDFYSMCEHHFLPFFGTAHVGYIPRGRIVGVSKLARVVEILSRRPQIQERLTSQIADTIRQALEPAGVAVVMKAEHLCMTMRGVKKPGSRVVTSATRGLFRRDPRTRAEFLALLEER